MLTAAELHAIVKDWPAGARPDGVSFESVSQQWQVDPHPRVTIHVPIPDAHAVMLHEVSAIRWLIGDIKPYPKGSRTLNIQNCGRHWHINRTTEHSGSLLDALSAAVLGVGG